MISHSWTKIANWLVTFGQIEKRLGVATNRFTDAEILSKNKDISNFDESQTAADVDEKENRDIFDYKTVILSNDRNQILIVLLKQINKKINGTDLRFAMNLLRRVTLTE